MTIELWRAVAWTWTSRADGHWYGRWRIHRAAATRQAERWRDRDDRDAVWIESTAGERIEVKAMPPEYAGWPS